MEPWMEESSRFNGKMKATGWLVKAETAVWWDMDACPVPEDLDARNVGPCIDRALEDLGYTGPLSITAVSKNLKHTPVSVVQALSSSGMVIKKAIGEGGSNIISTLFFWGNYPPPANIMVISPYKIWMHPVLSRLEKQGYNIFVANPHPLPYSPSGWAWETLLKDAMSSAKKKPLLRRKLRQDEPDPFSCALCHASFKIHEDFTTHLHGKEHELNEYLCGIDFLYVEENVATIMSKQLKSELKNVVVKAGVIDSSVDKAMVCWDIDSCEVPPDYNACDVSPRMESKFKNFGFSGTLTITAIGTLAYADAPLLCDIASTGINVKRVQFGCASIIDHVLTWATLNPPPAKIMIISRRKLLKRMSPALESLEKAGYDIISSSLKTILKGEEKSSDDEPPEAGIEMGKDASIICSTCNLTYKTFDSFVHHFNSEEHRIQAFRTCYYYLNKEPGSGTRYSPAVKELSKEGLHTSSFLMNLTKSFRKSKLNEQAVVAGDGSSCATVTTGTMAKRQSKRNLKKRRTE